MDSSDKVGHGAACSRLRLSDDRRRVVLDGVRNLVPDESGVNRNAFKPAPPLATP